MNKINELAIKLVSAYQGSSNTAGCRYAVVKIGQYVEVRMADNFSGQLVIEVNWPGIGAQSPAVAAEFAADLGIAAMVAALANATMGAQS